MSTSSSASTSMTTRRPTARDRKRVRETETKEEVIVVQAEEDGTTTTSITDTVTTMDVTSDASSSIAISSTTTTTTTTTSTSASSSARVSKVRRTPVITQPTMERFSRRLAASAEDVAAKELKENPFRLDWIEHETLIYLGPKSKAASSSKNKIKVASFDMDGTLIRTASGRQFPVGRRDWVWFSPEVPKKLAQLHADGWTVVIFTNQNGISTGKQPKADIKGKILDIIKDCNVPMQAYVASADDLYRKPATSMWTFFQQMNSGSLIDMSSSVYVGDAAGRPANWNGGGVKKDFSASDRKFAHNCALEFHTPEEYFLGQPKAKFSWGAGIDPTIFATTTTITTSSSSSSKVYPVAAASSSSPSPIASPSPSPSPSTPAGPYHVKGVMEVVIFCGFPASGKSTFARRHFLPHGYAHVNQDTLKTKEKCVKATIEALTNGKSVVVDNTNPSAEVRSLYISQARKFGAQVRCFQFITQEDVAKHLNMFREKLTDGAHRHVPRIAYATYKKNFQAPNVKEGFKEIKLIDFVPYFPSTPDGEKAKQLFYELS